MLLLLVACQNEDEGANRETIQSHSIKSVIENNYRSNDESRTSVDEEGHVSWIETDRLGVFGTITQNACFTSSGTGTEVDFTGELSEGDKEIVCVYYPYDEDATFDNNSLTFTLPNEYTYTGNSHAPMLGVEQEDGSYLFKHLCGLMRVTVKGVPEGTSTFKVTSVGENALGIAGKARVADITSTDAVLSLEDEVSKTVTVTLETEEIMDATFYIPLPVGTYSQLSVTYSDDSKEYFTKTTSNVTIERGMLLDMPVLTALDDDAVVDDYLNKIDAYVSLLDTEDYTELKNSVISWLEDQSFITSVKVYENKCYDDINLTFEGGHFGFISLVKEQEDSTVDSRLISESLAFGKYGYKNTIFHIPAKDGEVVFNNMKSKSYTFLDLIIDDMQETYYNWALSESPLLLDNQNLSDRTQALKDLFDNKKTFGVLLLTGTHGLEDVQGAFKIEYEGNIDYANSENFKEYKAIPGYIYDYKTQLLKIKALAVGADFLLNEIFDEQTLVYGSYCWSYTNNNRHTGNFIGHKDEALIVNNAIEIWNFFYPLFCGMTVSESYDILNEYKVYDLVFNSNDGLDYNKKIPNQRYFSISTNELKHGTEVAQSISVTGKINGYKNLKSSIKPVVYWKKGTEPFSSPLEEGIEKGYYDKSVGSNHYNHSHPNIGKFLHYDGQYDIILENLEMYTTYQVAIGFEYTTNGQTKYYWGDVKEITTGGDPDREALIELYNTHHGENWENVKNWCTTDTKLYSWTGVQTKIVNGEERVKKLTLDNSTRLTDILDLTKFTYLEEICVRNIDLSLLDVSNLLYLKRINDGGNYIAFTQKEGDTIQELDASGCISLNGIHLPNNTYFINLSGCIGIGQTLGWSGGSNVGRVDASECAFTHVDLRNKKNIKDVILQNCTNLVSFTAENTAIETLDLSGCIKLGGVSCKNTNLKSLNLLNCSELKTFDCDNTQLLDLNLTNCSKLESFSCSNNQLNNIVGIKTCENLSSFKLNGTNLSTLDVSGLKKLSTIECYNSQLTSLNVNGCTDLISIRVYNNKLTHLNLSTNEKLRTLVCADNPLTGTLDLSDNILIGHVDIHNTNLTVLNIDTKKRGASKIKVLAKGTKLKDVYVHNRCQLIPCNYIVLYGYGDTFELWGALLEEAEGDKYFWVKEEKREANNLQGYIEVDFYSEFPEIHFSTNNNSEPSEYFGSW